MVMPYDPNQRTETAQDGSWQPLGGTGSNFPTTPIRQPGGGQGITYDWNYQQPGTQTQNPTPYSNTLDSPTGETPLTKAPVWGGTGGGPEAAAVYAWNDFVQQFGRNPTQSELNQISPSYIGTDKNFANLGQGRQMLAQYYQSIANSPANVYSRQQKQWEQNAPKSYDSVNQIVKNAYGRDATQDELKHYGTLIASGQADPYQIQQFVQSTPEYQNAQDKQFRSGLDTELQQSDQNFFNTAKGDIIQKYAQMGRATSPALDVALTDLASTLSDKRQTYLSQLSASQYGGNKAAAVANYSDTQKQVNDRINQNASGIYKNQQNILSRGNDIADYHTQADAYAQAAKNAQKGPSWMDYLNTGLSVAKTGAEIYAM